MTLIKVIEHEDSDGELRIIYDNLISKRGKIAEVHKIQSLNPESITRHMDLYMTLMFGKSPLSRLQREMIAVVVSVTNQCHYCITHHTEALKMYLKDDTVIAALHRDFAKASISNLDLLLCELAWQLTRIPNISTEVLIQKLKAQGLDDRAILDATLVIGYFNFVNRLVLGLGVKLEDDKGKGYNY